MKPVKILGIVLAILGIILGGALYCAFHNAMDAGNIVFQIVLAASLILFFSGIGVIFISKGKEDPIEILMNSRKQAPVRPAQNVPKTNLMHTAASQANQFSLTPEQYQQQYMQQQNKQMQQEAAYQRQSAQPINQEELARQQSYAAYQQEQAQRAEYAQAQNQQQASQSISLAEEFAQRKRQYYAEAAKPIEQPAPIPQPAQPVQLAQPAPKPTVQAKDDKVKFNFSMPFGKKKPQDEYHKLLDKEEAAAKGEIEWEK